MTKYVRKQNGRSNVRVLHFPASAPVPPGNDVNADALADAIRKAWTTKPSSALKPDRNILVRPARLANNEG
ncbi:MAG TPA: hypothetical protein VFT65_12420 [Candidatus Angelobacter sp.]|nr:hypothetical protein [Candidatus Angelobacter sp.]